MYIECMDGTAKYKLLVFRGAMRRPREDVMMWGRVSHHTVCGMRYAVYGMRYDVCGIRYAV